LPSSEAVNVHVPDATMVTVAPETVHTLVVDDVTVGVSPDVAEIVNPKVVVDNVFVPGFVNEIVFVP
jgi:propanediol utilization protein